LRNRGRTEAAYEGRFWRASPSASQAGTDDIDHDLALVGVVLRDAFEDIEAAVSKQGTPLVRKLKCESSRATFESPAFRLACGERLPFRRLVVPGVRPVSIVSSSASSGSGQAQAASMT